MPARSAVVFGARAVPMFSCWAVALATTSLLTVRALLPPGFKWPGDVVVPRSSENIKIAKTAGRQIACQVCHFRLLAVFYDSSGKMENDMVDEFVNKGKLNKMLQDGGSNLCNQKELTDNMRRGGLVLETAPGARATIGFTENKDSFEAWPEVPEVEDEEIMSWKGYAVHHACLESFRRSGSDVAKAFKEALANFRKQGGEAELDSAALSHLTHQACRHSKLCLQAEVELRLDNVTEMRATDLAREDTSFSPQLADFFAPPVRKFEKYMNYYKVVGVPETAATAQILAAVRKLSLLYGSHEAAEDAGISVEDADAVMGQLRAAESILTDRATRRQYDRERDRMFLEVQYGLRKPKVDKSSFDGESALNAFEEEFEQLAHRKSEAEL